jgi:hypothetical protein
MRYLPIQHLRSFHRDPAYISTYPELINLPLHTHDAG